MRRRLGSALARLLGTAALAALAACEPAPADVREWTPADHDQPAPGQGQQVAERPASSAGGDTDLVELAWQRNCFTCHGARGRGDGPQGAMLKVRDLTDPAWQDQVSDAQIVEVIQKGRNKMPAFDLPPQVLQGLAARIRAARAR